MCVSADADTSRYVFHFFFGLGDRHRRLRLALVRVLCIFFILLYFIVYRMCAVCSTNSTVLRCVRAL